MELPLRVPTLEGLAPEISAAQRWNCYLEQGGDASAVTMICRPGTSQKVAATGAGKTRSRAYRYNGEMWYVRGDKLYSFDGTTVTERGTLNTSTGPVSFADNGPDIFDQLMLVDGTDGYIWNSSADTFTTISDADFPASPIMVAYINFLFVVFDGGTQKFYTSASGDGTSWAALDFASAEAVPDNLKALFVEQQQLILVGERSTEFWTYTGNVDFPFERFQNGVIDSGTEAGFSVVKVDTSVLYLEDTDEGGRRFVMPQGQAAVVVSPNWLNVLLDRMTVVSDCYGYAMKYRGHEFVIYQFPTEGETFVYDASTREWHRWSSFVDGKHKRLKWANHCYLSGKHYTVLEDGTVCQIDEDTYSDNGDVIRMEWVSGHVKQPGSDPRIKHVTYQLQMAEGVGLLGEDAPQVMLQWSDDGGHTWSNEHWRSMGARGKYGTRVRWNRLGSSRDRVYRHAITDSVKRIVIAQEVELAAA